MTKALQDSDTDCVETLYGRKLKCRKRTANLVFFLYTAKKPFPPTCTDCSSLVRSLFQKLLDPQSDETSPDDVKSMGVDALSAYKGSTLVYVGEPLDSQSSSSERISRTAGPRFERSLKEGGWKLQKQVELPHWPKCGDRLQVWTREVAKISSSGNDAKDGKGETAEETASSTKESEKGDPAEESVGALQEKLLNITKSASSSEETVDYGTEGEGKKMVIKFQTMEVSPDTLVKILKVSSNLEKAQLAEVRRQAGTRVGKAERQAYMEMLRATWDAVASDLIARRVYKEWHVRKVHAPLSRIEEETNERHIARQGFLRRLLMRLGYKIVKDKEDRF